MSKYDIAGITVEMEPKYETLKRQSSAYAVNDSKKTDLKLMLSDRFLLQKQQNNPHLTLNECEYLWYGFDFYRSLPMFGGIMLHSSCIAVDGEAYLFSAPCGTGKSTHTSLWKQYFGDRAVFINDDKPAIRIFDEKFYACGTPFSGKTDLNTNMKAPIKGICVLERGEDNKIFRIDAKEALPKILNQIYRPSDHTAMEKTLDILNNIFSNIPVYKLFCNISMQAVEVSYSGMENKI